MSLPLAPDDPQHPDYHRRHPGSENLRKQARYISQQDGLDSDLSDIWDHIERGERREIQQNSDNLD